MIKIIQSEFPEKVSWTEFKNLVDFPLTILVAVSEPKEYYHWKKIIGNKFIKVGAWPILDKKEGYWFSGYCSKETIDKLDKFNSIRPLKIDLEFPIPEGKYSNFKLIWHAFKLLFKKPENYQYLIEKIKNLNQKNLIINEFPFPNFIKKRLGIYYPYKTFKNYMFYTTYAGIIFRWPIILSNLLAEFFHKPDSIALGLIGSGIFTNEREYKTQKQFKSDIKIFKPKNVILYSVETIMKRKNPEEWIKVIKKI